jgi:hypothetical protein
VIGLPVSAVLVGGEEGLATLRLIVQSPPFDALEQNNKRLLDFHRAKYVKGIKILMAFISKTAKRMNIMTPKKVALKGVVAEPTWRRIRRMFNNICITIASSNYLTE